MKPSPAFRHALAAGLVRALLAIVRALPSRVLLPIGSVVGLAAWAASPGLRLLGDGNLRRAFPTLDASDRARTLRACARWLGEAAVEAVSVAFGQRTVASVVRIPAGVAAMLGPSPSGILVATGHVGNWELLGSALASMGHATYAVVRQSRNIAIATQVTALRQRLGWHEIPRDQYVALHALRALRAGGLVGLLCDQSSDQSVVDVPFLDIPAPTPRGPAVLARRSGARLVVAWLRRESAFAYVMEAVAVKPSEDDAVTMAHINAILSAVIRARPSEWVWFHERWPSANVSSAPTTPVVNVVARDGLPESP